ncbi:MAG: LysR substrate-binding domain-containing protein, partial [Alphaproteobacteria bacterium]
LPAVRDAFDRLATATDQLLAANTGSTLTVSLLASFAAQWLVPRIASFRDHCPDIDIRLHAVDTLIDFARDDVDIAIRYGRGVWPGLRIDKLRDENVFPVCSPALLAGPIPLAQPSDLANHLLLHESSVPIDWRTWLATAGLSHVESSRGTTFSHGHMVVQAAVNGQGVALGRTPLIEAELAQGKLVKPFDMSMSANYAHYIVCPLATADQPKIVAFREWLLDQAFADQTSPENQPASRK